MLAYNFTYLEIFCVRCKAILCSLTWLLLIPFCCQATNFKPWLDNQYEAVLRATIVYQNYSSIANPCHYHRRNPADDLFTIFSVAYPFKSYCGEFEAILADTKHQNCRLDNLSITGRYQWLDEVTKDPFALVTGIKLMQPLTRALHDISSFHHGHIEAEGFLAWGQRYSPPCSRLYTLRWWNVLGIGVADRGRPWLRSDLACEYKSSGNHCWRGFIHTLWGLGNRPLLPCHFRGYGRIKHRSVDVGIRYSHSIAPFGTLSIQYARRLYAYNFPQNTNLLTFHYYFPFGSQPYTNY